ncbi:hypothetical protein QYM36_006234 [Artemia franciscana]|uniref:Uncharacterized protein n=1 Tax=Artemia franciscana TaxID=6661 RepID=A0AA88HY93_ARTSF|nr:hypothetical protein QYM36_006234 [Artemia franciscana]
MNKIKKSFHVQSNIASKADLKRLFSSLISDFRTKDEQERPYFKNMEECSRTSRYTSSDTKVSKEILRTEKSRGYLTAEKTAARIPKDLLETEESLNKTTPQTKAQPTPKILPKAEIHIKKDLL